MPFVAHETALFVEILGQIAVEIGNWIAVRQSVLLLLSDILNPLNQLLAACSFADSAD